MPKLLPGRWSRSSEVAARLAGHGAIIGARDLPGAITMPDLGRFLELSLPTADIQASLGFYLALGFTELAVNDIRASHYAAVTDGAIAIGLHGAGLEEPALAFVRPELAPHARTLMAAGTEFAFQRLGEDDFHEAGLYAPDGVLVVLLEAPTFPEASAEDARAGLLGRSVEISLGTRDMAVAGSFWEQSGLVAGPESTAEHQLLFAPGLTLGLRRDQPTGLRGLRFELADPARALAELERVGVDARRQGANWLIQSPEGLALVCTAAD